MPLEIPFEPQRVESCAVCGISRLERKKDWDRIDGVFESPAKKTWEMRTSQDPSIAQPGIENARIAAAARNGMASSSPSLNLIRAFFRSSLRA